MKRKKMSMLVTQAEISHNEGKKGVNEIIEKLLVL